MESMLSLAVFVRRHKSIHTARVELHLAQSDAGAARTRLNPDADGVRELRRVFEPVEERRNVSKDVK